MLLLFVESGQVEGTVRIDRATRKVLAVEDSQIPQASLRQFPGSL